MSIGNGCVYQSVILHELMHAVGFDHEQNRPDQTRYITVNFTNILPRKIRLIKACYNYNN